MSVKLIFGLSLGGLLMAIATAFVVPAGAEAYAWLAIFGLSGLAIAKRAPGRYVLHGLAVSILDALWVTGAHVALYDQYLAVHGRLVSNLTAHGSPPLMMLLAGAAIGIVGGIALGVFAWVSSKFVVSSHSEFAGW